MKVAFSKPKREMIKSLNVRLRQEEWEDVRRIAIAENLSLAGVVRELVAERKAKLIKANRWPEETER